jgi:hypothetical protein
MRALRFRQGLGALARRDALGGLSARTAKHANDRERENPDYREANPGIFAWKLSKSHPDRVCPFAPRPQWSILTAWEVLVPMFAAVHTVNGPVAGRKKFPCPVLSLREQT